MSNRGAERKFGSSPDVLEDDVTRFIDNLAEAIHYNDAVLTISHSNYLEALGGTEKVIVEEQQALFSRRVSYIQIYPLTPFAGEPDRAIPDRKVGVTVDGAGFGTITIVQLALLLGVLCDHRRLRLLAVHIHHLMDLPLEGIAFLIETLAAPTVRLFVHDYYTICSSFNLLTDDMHYCGVQDNGSTGCGQCTRCGDNVAWQARMNAFLNRIDPLVVAPSETAGSIWAAVFPAWRDRIQIVPHQRLEPIEEAEHPAAAATAAFSTRLKIAYVGYESRNKGIDAWWRLVQEPRIQAQYELYHFGAAGRRLPGVTYVPVSFHDAGPAAMVDALAAHAVDIAFLWSIWPETYAFTVYEALAAGCFVVTNTASGNIAAQVRKRGNGKCFESERAMHRFLLDNGQTNTAVGSARRQGSGRMGLIFNTHIADQTALATGRTASSGPADERHEYSRAIELNRWFALLGRYAAAVHTLEGAHQDLKRQTDHLKRQSDHLNVQLDVYRRSHLHRMADVVLRWVNRHPRLAGRARPFVARLGARFYDHR